jgi:hypothetical protein
MAQWQKPQPTSRLNIFAVLIFCASAVLATLALIHRHEHVGRRDGHRPPTADFASGRLLASVARHGTRSMVPPIIPASLSS